MTSAQESRRDPGDDSRELAAYIESNFGEFIEEYLQLYIGHIHCGYEFVEDETMNAMADDRLREMTAHAVSIMRRVGGTLENAPDQIVEYAASVAVLGIIEFYSNARSTVIDAEYAGTAARCLETRADNERRYHELRRP